jgi:hypothetical protein
MSAPSKRSRSITKAFDQMSSSTGEILTVMPSTVASGALANQSSSTALRPLPLLKIRSTDAPAFRAFASQCGYARSVSKPASRSDSSANGRSVRRRKHVDVLGRTLDTGVSIEGEASADQVLDVPLLQSFEDASIERAGTRSEFSRRRHGGCL